MLENSKKLHGRLGGVHRHNVSSRFSGSDQGRQVLPALRDLGVFTLGDEHVGRLGGKRRERNEVKFGLRLV